MYSQNEEICVEVVQVKLRSVNTSVLDAKKN